MATTFEKWETDINERENTQYENETTLGLMMVVV